MRPPFSHLVTDQGASFFSEISVQKSGCIHMKGEFERLNSLQLIVDKADRLSKRLHIIE